eukprot:328081_1
MSTSTPIAEDSKYVIFGYIRRMKNQKDMQHDFDVPTPIKHLCALFFGCIKRQDYFEYSGHQMDIKEINTTIVKHKDNSRTTEWNTAYGTLIINPLFNKQYIWKFCIKNKKGSICIGIDALDSHASRINVDFCGRSNDDIHYAYCGNGRTYSSSNDSNQYFYKTYAAGDIVSMKLDFTSESHNGTLSYKLNHDKTYQIAFHNISSDTKYKMGVSMDARLGYCSVKLLDFSESIRLLDCAD